MSEVIEKSQRTAAISIRFRTRYECEDGRGISEIEVKIPGGNTIFRTARATLRRMRPARKRDERKEPAGAEAGRPEPRRGGPATAFMDLGCRRATRFYTKPHCAAAAGRRGRREEGGEPLQVEFFVDLKDLDLKLDSDGQHKGMLNLSLIAYDRYGKVASRKENVVELNIKPDAYAVFQQTGVQLRTEIGVPKGQYWLRTGVYDQDRTKWNDGSCVELRGSDAGF